jgi:hypothetical protein
MTTLLVAPITEGVRLDATDAAYDRAVSALADTLPALRARIAAIERIRDDWAGYLHERDAPSIHTGATGEGIG